MMNSPPSRTKIEHSRAPSDPNNLTVLRKVACSTLSQAINLLQHTITTDLQISTVSKLVPGSTIAKHLRHLHDHFRILLDAVNSDDRYLNYDSRKRNLIMEKCHKTLLREFISLSERLLPSEPSKTLNEPPEADVQLTLIAITPTKISLGTTFSRELWFASLHATHHFALIKAIVIGDLGLQLPAEFGVAPSTLIAEELAKM